MNVKIKFELNRLTDYSDEAIIREIQRVAAAVNVSPLKQAAFNKESKVSSCTVVQRFGSWKNALEKVGLENLWSGGIRENVYSDEQLIAELRRVATLLGKTTVTKEEFNSHGKISSTTIQSRFGWSAALKLAELEVSNIKRYIENDY